MYITQDLPETTAGVRGVVVGALTLKFCNMFAKFPGVMFLCKSSHKWIYD
jgi:hypothetical protein